MLNRDKIRVIEYNCRFGNPSSMNIISIMKISFTKFCENLINQKLNELKDIFNDDIVSLSLYVLPKDYTKNKNYVGTKVDFSQINLDNFYYGNMNYKDNSYYLKNSLAFSICTTAETMEEARNFVYSQLSKIKGIIYFRRDNGKNIK